MNTTETNELDSRRAALRAGRKLVGDLHGENATAADHSAFSEWAARSPSALRPI